MFLGTDFVSPGPKVAHRFQSNPRNQFKNPEAGDQDSGLLFCWVVSLEASGWHVPWG